MKSRPERHYERLRLDSGHHRRILLTAAVLGMLAFVPVGLRLYDLMVTNYDYYAQLALRNQTRTTRVEAARGDICDRNMNILATTVGVENVYLDPHELKQSKADIPAISQKLGLILGKDPGWIQEQAADFKQRYKQIGTRIDEETTRLPTSSLPICPAVWLRASRTTWRSQAMFDSRMSRLHSSALWISSATWKRETRSLS